ncbi:MAG: hypothetical protein MUO67_12100 [Anaerolineales bacterium]|nr:hypothetical protein [Anaerolineales bacterium]
MGSEEGGVSEGSGIGLDITHSFDPEVRERVQAKETERIVITMSQNLMGKIDERCIESYSILKTMDLTILKLQD